MSTRTLALAAAAGLALATHAAAGPTCGVFVSTTGEDNAGGGLATDDPVRTIGFAIQRAIDESLDCVFVQQGEYTEVVRPRGGVEIIGGFDDAWASGPLSNIDHQVRIVGALDKTLMQFVTVVGDSGEAGALTNVIIEGPDAMGANGATARSSYAVYININNADITLTDVRVEAGDGAPGADGADGVNAPQFPAPGGMPGVQGAEVFCSTDFEIGGAGAMNGGDMNTKGGRGGNGGRADTSCPFGGPATSGSPGQNADVAGGGFGNGGSHGSPCNSGADGQDGRVQDGEGGLGSTGFSGAGLFWTAFPGFNGTTGLPGGGGGGGGGAGGCDSPNARGSSGGGGAAGGQRAPVGGQRGVSGGGSFGAYVVTNSILTVSNVEFVRGVGGDGGDGGDAGLGQPGGPGGMAPAPVSGDIAGRGGDGGRGGHAGAGGAGRGGPSIGLLVQNGAVFNDLGFTVHSGAAGLAGQGGAGPTPALEGGETQDGELLDTLGSVRAAERGATDAQAAKLAARLDRGACDPAPCLPSPPCPADLTGDGVVSSEDLGALLAAWGPCP